MFEYAPKKLTSWSPSRLDKWETCPRQARYEYIDKLCPMCFKGTIKGFDNPVCVGGCGKPLVKAEPLERGSRLDKSLEEYITGRENELDGELGNPVVQTHAVALRKEYAAGRVGVQYEIVLNDKWQPVHKFDRSAWLRTKLDVLWRKAKTAWRVLDWKSGGIDKRTGEAREAPEKYDNQLELYGIVTLASFPEVKKTNAALIFVDARNPVVERAAGTVTRKALPVLQEKWQNRVAPMLNDSEFSPRPGFYCTFCPFAKGKGGPCMFGDKR